MYLESSPPIITNITDGTPIFRSSFLSNPFLKRNTLLILLDKWKTAVSPSTAWNAKKKEPMGTKKTEDPNPPMVPITSANKARSKKTI